jgi:tRNA A37 threonylcarbamoyladenosine biosynthesis protein TsaE
MNIVPTIINGRYAILPNARNGRFADIYRASDLQCDAKVVAIKLFRNGMPDDALIRESFERESQRLIELRHENIVSMFDYGIETETARPYLALEWAGDPIELWWKQNRPGRVAWDDFYSEIGKPLLNALAFAHSRETVHRELKPADILRGKNGEIRLADFGVAKFPEFFDAELDIDSFLKDKEPFAPVDGYEPSFSYATDIFGFGAIALYFMGGLNIRTWDQLYKALQLSTAPKEIRDILEECLAHVAAERPLNALVLQSRLRNADVPVDRPAQKSHCYFNLTNKAFENLRLVYGSSLSLAEVGKCIETDFSEVFAIERATERDAGGPVTIIPHHKYMFYGETLSLIVAADVETKSKLLIIGGRREASFDRLEQLRAKSYQAPLHLRIGEWANHTQGEEFIKYLEEALDDQANKFLEEKLKNAAEEFFWTWKGVLDLRLDHCRNGRFYDYNGYEIDGDRVVFQVEGNPDGTEIEEIWKIADSKISGLVESVGENSLAMVMLGEEPENLRKSGRLHIDASATEKQLRKQQQALDAIRYPKSENTERLRNVILHPADSRTDPHLMLAPEWFNSQIDDNKKDTIVKALAAKDFFVVEGPPGTGKTTFIAELILQHLRQWPDKRILVTSQTHIAVDNAIERVAQIHPDLKIVRIGYIETKVSENAHAYLLQKRVQEWSERVREQAADFLKIQAKSEGIDITKIQVGLDISVLLANQKQLADTKAYEDEASVYIADLELKLSAVDKTGVAVIQGEKADMMRTELQLLETELEEIRKSRQERSKTLRDKKEQFKKSHHEWAELADASPDELMTWQKEMIGDTDKEDKFRRLFELSSEWIQRFFLKEDCQEAILADSDVVAGTCIGVESSLSDEDLFGLCILDEASKATMTEALVPLRRSEKWILVGDRLQLSPFVEAAFQARKNFSDTDIKEEIFRQTLLDRLLENNLPQACNSILTRQHRMLAPIGDLVSSVFYENRLESVRNERELDLSIALSHSVMWFTTSRVDNRREHQSGTSLINALETQWIAKLLERIDFLCGTTKKIRKTPEVAVLTGYAAQRNHISARVDTLGLKNLHIECHTVDAYQGREADIVIFSVTSSHSSGRPGFLSDKRRINVALSRAREYLLIVGDGDFCANLASAPSLGQVFTYIEEHSDTCSIQEVE